MGFCSVQNLKIMVMNWWWCKIRAFCYSFMHRPISRPKMFCPSPWSWRSSNAYILNVKLEQRIHRQMNGIAFRNVRIQESTQSRKRRAYSEAYRLTISVKNREALQVQLHWVTIIERLYILGSWFDSFDNDVCKNRKHKTSYRSRGRLQYVFFLKYVLCIGLHEYR